MLNKMSIDDLKKVHMRVGTIIDASINKGTRKPAYNVKIDFFPKKGKKIQKKQF